MADKTTTPQPLVTAPKDGSWIDVRCTENGNWLKMRWFAEGNSWNSDFTKLVQTGIWTDDDGWLQPNEVNAWRMCK